MGWQWCPRDPLVQIGDHTLLMVARVPVQYRNRIEAMEFLVRVPRGIETETLYIEPEAVVRFLPEEGRRRGKELNIEVSCYISGVPYDVPAEMVLFGPWSDSAPVRVQATADSLNARIVL